MNHHFWGWWLSPGTSGLTLIFLHDIVHVAIDGVFKIPLESSANEGNIEKSACVLQPAHVSFFWGGSFQIHSITRFNKLSIISIAIGLKIPV